MKRVIVGALAVLLTVAATGCTERTEFGECYGLINDDEQSDDLVYRTDKGNVVMGVLLFETIIVPVVVFGWETKCPVARKNK